MVCFKELSLLYPGDTGENHSNLNYGRHEPASSEYKSRAYSIPISYPSEKSGKGVMSF
jgi:hypothetical protein